MEDYFKKYISLIKSKDNNSYLAKHSENVALYSYMIGEKLNLKKDELEKLYYAGYLHDIGKLEMPLEILQKKDKLTSEEYEKIKYHPVYSQMILSDKEFLKEIGNIVRSHHERLDGMGYPDGLKENEIPFLSKIISISDTFDAMTTDRGYQKVKSVADAIIEIKNVSGTQLDEVLANVFINTLNEFGNNKDSILDSARNKIYTKM